MLLLLLLLLLHDSVSSGAGSVMEAYLVHVPARYGILNTIIRNRVL